MSSSKPNYPIPNFDYRMIDVDDIRINVATKGRGEPLLLLHGFPETHLAWRMIAPELAEEYHVVCMDLRGYGDSDKPKGDASYKQYSKRTMAADALAVMRSLGHNQFTIVGHDRGALVGFRLALDYPEAVRRLAVLDTIPTINMMEVLSGVFAVFGYHMYFLAQPSDLPERMIEATPELFLNRTLDSWCKVAEALPGDIRSVYLRAFTQPGAIHAMCQDYRAGAFVDIGDDAASKAADAKVLAPVLALWQDPQGMELPFDPLAVWQNWAYQVQGRPITCGHFLAEEKPAEVLDALLGFMQEPAKS